MKVLFIVLAILSFSAFSAADVVGTWAYSGSGCRNSSLDSDSHRSKASKFSREVVEIIFNFYQDERAEMNAIMGGKRMHETGTYTLSGNRLTISDPGTGIDEVDFTVQGDTIIVNTKEPEEQKLCNSGDVFVYILSKVD